MKVKAAIYVQRQEKDSFFIQVCFYFHVQPVERTCHNLNGGGRAGAPSGFPAGGQGALEGPRAAVDGAGHVRQGPVFGAIRNPAREN